MSDAIQLLDKGTGAANSDPIDIDSLPVTLKAYPVSNMAAEVGAVVEKNPDGTWDPMFDLLGTEIKLGATLPSVVVEGITTVRVEYSARTSAVGVTAKVGSR